MLLFYIINFFQIFFYKFKRLPANKELRIFSMKIKLDKKLLLYINLYISYYYFYSENFYKFKSPLANKELRIFSIRIK